MTDDIGTILGALSNYPRARWECTEPNLARITFSAWVFIVDDRGLSIIEKGNDEEDRVLVWVSEMTTTERDSFTKLRRNLFFSTSAKNTLKSAANFFAEVARK